MEGSFMCGTVLSVSMQVALSSATNLLTIKLLL